MPACSKLGRWQDWTLCCDLSIRLPKRGGGLYRILVTHKTILVGDGFDWRKGRKMVVRLTKLVKLTLIS